MKYMKKLLNNGNGVFEECCSEYMKTKHLGVYYISDIYQAFIDGCNVVTQQQHDKAIPFAEEYISKKSHDVVYSITNIERAYRDGAKSMAEEWGKKQIEITPRRVEKASKLICAGSQLMSLAENFNKEAEKLMSNEFTQMQISNKYNKIKDLFDELKSIFKEWNKECEGIFRNLSIDDNFKWGEENEKLEYAIRKIMKIDR